MTVLYNEFDKNAAAWLRELIYMGAIADGYVDQRSILELTPSDIRKHRCAHFFAGIGGWSYALRLAGIPDDYPVWTASLPCQPFSVAGKQLGKNDERHLLPHFLELIRECKPDVIFGEQVEGAIRHGWLDDLQANLEAEGYAVGYCVLGAHSVGAPHIRQRLYWVAVSEGAWRCGRESMGIQRHTESGRSGENSGVACPESIGLERGWSGDGAGMERGWSGDGAGMERGWSGDGAGMERGWSGDGPGKHSRIREDRERFGYRHSGGTDDGLVYPSNSGRQSITNLQSTGICGEALQQTEQREQSGDLRTTFSNLANPSSEGLQEQHGIERISPGANGYDEGKNAAGSFGMGDTESEQEQPSIQGGFHPESSSECFSSGLGDTPVHGYSPYSLRRPVEQSKNESRLLQSERPDSPWAYCDWIYCRDGKYRPIKSGLKPLVNRLPRGMVHSGDSSIAPNETAEARAMRLKGYGNAIVPQTAAEFIKAIFEALDLY